MSNSEPKRYFDLFPIFFIRCSSALRAIFGACFGSTLAAKLKRANFSARLSLFVPFLREFCTLKRSYSRWRRRTGSFSLGSIFMRIWAWVRRTRQRLTPCLSLDCGLAPLPTRAGASMRSVDAARSIRPQSPQRIPHCLERDGADLVAVLEGDGEGPSAVAESEGFESAGVGVDEPEVGDGVGGVEARFSVRSKRRARGRGSRRPSPGRVRRRRCRGRPAGARGASRRGRGRGCRGRGGARARW